MDILRSFDPHDSDSWQHSQSSFFELQSHQTKQSLSPAPAHSQELTPTPELCPFLCCHGNWEFIQLRGKAGQGLIWFKNADVLKILCSVTFWKMPFTNPVHSTLVVLVGGGSVRGLLLVAVLTSSVGGPTALPRGLKPSSPLELPRCSFMLHLI